MESAWEDFSKAPIWFQLNRLWRTEEDEEEEKKSKKFSDQLNSGALLSSAILSIVPDIISSLSRLLSIDIIHKRTARAVNQLLMQCVASTYCAVKQTNRRSRIHLATIFIHELILDLAKQPASQSAMRKNEWMKSCWWFINNDIWTSSDFLYHLLFPLLSLFSGLESTRRIYLFTCASSFLINSRWLGAIFKRNKQNNAR